MKLLEDRIRKEGRVLPGGIIKVDGFLNHRVDPLLMKELAKEVRRLFPQEPTAILTCEASGIAFGEAVAEEFGVPMVFAKKAKSDNIEGGLYKSEIFSYTYKKAVTLIVAKDWLGPNDKVLVVDDVFDTGKTAKAVKEQIGATGAEMRLACVYWKPGKNTTDLKPDYFYRDVGNEWIVFPHEIEGLPKEEIAVKDPLLASLLG